MIAIVSNYVALGVSVFVAAVAGLLVVVDWLRSK